MPDTENAETFAAERIGELLILLAAKFDLTPEEGASILHMAVIENASLMDGPLEEPLATDVQLWHEEVAAGAPGSETPQ
jgi:hypothetical protein